MSMPPYYAKDGIVIYNADARDVLGDLIEAYTREELARTLD